jgi:hypothetical protein
MQTWWHKTEDKMIEAVAMADEQLFPARLRAGTGQAHISHNRRRLLPDGTVEMFWRNAEMLPTAPVDPTVHVLRVDDSEGGIRALVVNYSCHPTVLGPDNLEISADYVGVLRDYVEKEFPGALCLFVFGASGDINPYFDKQPVSQGAFEKVRWTGETLGRTVVDTANRLAADSEQPAAFHFETHIHTFKERWNPEKEVRVMMAIGLIGQEIGLVAVSADPFVAHQIRLRDQSPSETTFFLAHASSLGVPYARYLPTIRAAVEGGYGANYATTAEVGAGERLIDRAIVRLLELKGQLNVTPAW